VTSGGRRQFTNQVDVDKITLRTLKVFPQAPSAQYIMIFLDTLTLERYFAIRRERLGRGGRGGRERERVRTGLGVGVESVSTGRGGRDTNGEEWMVLHPRHDARHSTLDLVVCD